MSGSAARNEALIRALVAGLQQRDVVAVSTVLTDDAVYRFRDGLISEIFVTLEDPQGFDEFVA